MTNLIISVNCKWSSWKSYTRCPVTCGGGTQIRTRTKLIVEDHGGICSGLSNQERQCNTDPCPGTLHTKSFDIPKLCGELLVR